MKNAMKLRLRIGRQRAGSADTDIGGAVEREGAGRGPAAAGARAGALAGLVAAAPTAPTAPTAPAAPVATGSAPAASGAAVLAPAATVAPPHVPSPGASGRRVVRVGSFCRVGEIGQSAVTETGRPVLAVPAGRCGRWVYA